MFASIGARGMALTDATETPLDDLHTLVRTTWTVEFEDPRADRPLTMSSSFLLRQEPDGWRIAVYLNHQDVAAVIAADRPGLETEHVAAGRDHVEVVVGAHLATLSIRTVIRRPSSSSEPSLP